MAIRHLETDSLSNQDISSALKVGEYTADADRLVIVDISADQVAGNGDYVAYVKRQINGSGSNYVVLPTTTMTAAAGETAIAGQSGLISVRSGDVLQVYLKGLPGDTSTPDTVVRFYEVAENVIFPSGAIEFTYTLTDVVTSFPIADADVWISTDLAGANIIWRGTTDAFGVARDVFNNKPWLDPGTYYFFRQHRFYSFVDPDAEVVSP